MPQNPFFEKAAGCPDHDSLAEYVNKVKNEAESTEYFGLVTDEIRRASASVLDRLLELEKADDILITVGALKGIRFVTEMLRNRWPVDNKETDENE